jgi:hypothetical protein
MKWSDLPLRPDARMLRQFAAGWLVFFAALGAFQAWGHGRPTLGAVLAVQGAVLGGLGLVWPGVLRPLFVIATVLAFPIGWVVSLVMLVLMYFGVMTPVGLLLRLRGRDALGRRRAAPGESYWKPKPAVTDVRRYFRQY